MLLHWLMCWYLNVGVCSMMSCGSLLPPPLSPALVPTGLLVAVRVFACLPFLVGATAFWAVKGQRRIVKELTWG